MLAPERRKKILEVVTRNKSALVKDLCVLFDVTGETIRKDLTVLEDEGKLYKTHGGAYVREGVNNQIHASIRQTIFTQAKASIGKACAGLVQAGETILLDESTTSLAIAQQLRGVSPLTVITNSFKIVSTLLDAEGVRVILCGGELDPKNQSFVGENTSRMLQNYYADKAFVSCRGAGMATGITDGSESSGQIRRQMLQHAVKSYLVLDASKLDLVNFYKICDFDCIHAMVVDALPSAQWRQFLQERRIEVIETMV